MALTFFYPALLHKKQQKASLLSNHYEKFRPTAIYFLHQSKARFENTNRKGELKLIILSQ